MPKFECWMTEKDFIPSDYRYLPENGSVTWKAPSNIALVKYWGKKGNQIPANPSLSFTLDTSATTTTLSFSKKANSDDFSFAVKLDGEAKPDFAPKIQTFLERVEDYLPFLTSYHFDIDTSNSFPHSSGIASSASGMAALSLCLLDLERQFSDMDADHFNKKASFLARLGSGSACRSIKGRMVQWGSHPSMNESTDFFGVPYPYPVDAVFNTFQDTILLVHKGQKQVSSTVGHGLMHGHPFAAQRFEQAHQHLDALAPVLKTGDLDAFIAIVEREALTLHAMMMSSSPYFLLMKPGTLQIIEKIWAYRNEKKVPVCFTLDAGANVHMLYPEKYKVEVLQFIQDELVAHCENGQYICDQVGTGAVKIS